MGAGERGGGGGVGRTLGVYVATTFAYIGYWDSSGLSLHELQVSVHMERVACFWGFLSYPFLTC